RGLAEEVEQPARDGWIALARGARRREGDAQVVPGPGRQGLAACVGLEATSLSAGAGAAVLDADGVSQLAGGARRALLELAAHDDAGADGRADQHHDQVVHAAAGAGGALAPGGDRQLAR